MPDWVTIAVLGKTRGNRGEVTALPLSSKPDVSKACSEVYLFGVGRPSAIRSRIDLVPRRDAGLQISRASIPSPTPKRLRGAEVRVPVSERVPLEDGRVFPVRPGRLRGGRPRHRRVDRAR